MLRDVAQDFSCHAFLFENHRTGFSFFRHLNSYYTTAVKLDANRISSRLWQGSYPGLHSVREAGVDVLVLCAVERQAYSHRDVRVIRAPMDDCSVVLAETVNQAVSHAIAAHKKGKRVLVTCNAGLNRSGLVVAVMLTRLYGISGYDAVKQVQRCRPGALFNPTFVEYVRRIPGRPVFVPGNPSLTLTPG